jgi:hypothetical protein
MKQLGYEAGCLPPSNAEVKYLPVPAMNILIRKSVG